MQIKDMNGMREGGMRIEDFASGQKLMTQASVANGAEEAPVARGGGRAAVFFAGDMRPQAAGANYSRDSLKDESVAQELSRKEGSFSGPETAKWAMSMAVAGFSVEDLSGAREAGYDPEEMESNEIVTVLDKIKMHLAMGGKDISAMGGLSDAAIAEMTGGSIAESNAVSRAVEAAGASQEPGERIAEAFSAADVPFDEKTVADAAGALQMVGEIAEASGSAEPIAQESARDGNATEESEERTGQLTPAAMEFLLKNEQGPTIEHIYQGTFSQGRSGSPYGQAGPSQEELSALMPQIEKLLDRADLPADDVQKDNAGWMLEKGIPITADNLSYLNTLQTATIDFSEEAVLSDMAAAVEEGRQPREAYLVSGFAMEERAEEVMDTVERVSDDQVARVADRGEDITAANLKREMRREERGLTEPVSDITIAEDPAEVGEREAGAADETRGYSPEAVRAQRILMEARLVMTTQANFTLMKQGIALDTEPLENVVSRLRDLEQSFYRSTLAGAEEISEEELTLRIEQFETTNSRLDDLKEMPAALLGRIPDAAASTIEELSRVGRSMVKAYADAGERYETMRTEVRRDLGDSRAKAFSHIDELLEEMDLEPSAANRRAVRILGYNQQEITTESIAHTKANDELVQRAFKSLTPGVVAKMIKEGENPLHLSMEKLVEKSEEIKAVSPTDSGEGRFAEFLFRARQTGELSPQEQEAFLGICRLIYQVEKTDGAVIGQLLGQGADITMNNLMTAVRTRRHENREYTIDDDFGFSEFEKSSLSITDQIEMAFQTRRMKDAGDVLTPQKLAAFENEEAYLSLTPDRFAEALEAMPEDPVERQQKEEYETLLRQQIQDAARAEEQIYDVLKRYDQPQSPANLAAFTALMSNRNDMYRRLFPNNGREVFGTEAEGVREGEMGIPEVMEDIIRRFGEAVQTPKEMAEAQQNLEEIAENVMKTMIVEEPVGSIRVRDMQLTIRQIKTMGEIGRRTETYSMPIMVEDSVGNLTLKIIRAPEEERGQVRIAFDSENTGAVDASFRYEPDGVYGSIRTASLETRSRIEGLLEEISASMEAAAEQPVSIAFELDQRTDANDALTDNRTEMVPRTDGERPQAQTRALYGIARSFIDAMGRLG